jgi:hypothetical protein
MKEIKAGTYSNRSGVICKGTGGRSADTLALNGVPERRGTVGRDTVTFLTGCLRRVWLRRCRLFRRATVTRVEWEVRECALLEKTILVLGYTVANLGVYVRSGALEAIEVVQVINFGGVLHPLEELLVGNDPH